MATTTSQRQSRSISKGCDMRALQNTRNGENNGRRSTKPSSAKWAAVGILAAGLLLMPSRSGGLATDASAQVGCGLRFVATGDDIPAGHDVSNAERYADHLYTDHLKKW